MRSPTTAFALLKDFHLFPFYFKPSTTQFLLTRSVIVVLLSWSCKVTKGNSLSLSAVEEKMTTIPIKEENGSVRQIQLRLCVPTESKRFRVVILNHGSPPKASDRPLVSGFRCDSESAKWFLDRGFLVVSPIRRGYGASGGEWAEGYGSCNDSADFYQAGLETAKDIAASVDFVASLQEAMPDHMVVVGQSAGGWGTIAYNSLNHPRVSALINMAGGRGGHFEGKPNQNCKPDLLIKTVGQYVTHASTPMLWIYTENDSFFAPAISQSFYKSFLAGGGIAEFILSPSFGTDGHKLFTSDGGSAIWGPIFEKYLGQGN